VAAAGSVGQQQRDGHRPPLQRSVTRQEIDKLLEIQPQMYRQWELEEEGWRELPARAWPAYQPNEDELKTIQATIDKLRCNNKTKIYSEDADYDNKCQKLLFDLSTSLVFYTFDPHKGFHQYQELAKQGNVDAMVACGIILLEGIGGLQIREKEGIDWLEKAVELGSSQACYELGVVYYMGIDDIVQEDSTKAFALFQKAASSQNSHTAALYMMADCYLEGEGVPKSVARAVPLLYKAADRGHRFARQKIRELLAANKQQ